MSQLLTPLLVLALTATSASGQLALESRTERKVKLKESTEAPAALSLGYFGEQVTYPGLSVGYEYALRTVDISVERLRKNKSVLKRNAYVLRPQLGVWYHVGNSVGLLPSVDLEYRRTRKRWTWTAGVTAGYLQTFRTGTTYVATDDPEAFDERHLRGESSPQAGIVLGFGQDNRFAGTGNLNWGFRLRPVYQFQSNAYGRFRAFAEGSVSLPLNGRSVTR